MRLVQFTRHDGRSCYINADKVHAVVQMEDCTRTCIIDGPREDSRFVVLHPIEEVVKRLTPAPHAALAARLGGVP